MSYLFSAIVPKTDEIYIGASDRELACDSISHDGVAVDAISLTFETQSSFTADRRSDGEHENGDDAGANKVTYKVKLAPLVRLNRRTASPTI